MRHSGIKTKKVTEETSLNNKIQNILLIEPKSPDFNIYSLFKIPRMGLAILGTLAHQAGYNVKIIYQQVAPVTYKHILWADIVGFSIITSTAPEGYRLARMVKALSRQKNRHTKIIFGGVHVTFEPDEALRYGEYVFRGEAENTFVPFLHALRDKKSFEKIPGLSWKKEGKIIHNPMEKQKVNMIMTPGNH